jgi:drug/metabolite transporter (DMT)-like permease
MTPDTRTDNLRGGVLMVLAMAGFALEDMLIKYLSASLPTGQIMILIGALGTLAMGAFAKARGIALFGRFLLSPAVMLRNLGEMFGALCFVTALAMMPLSVATALFQTFPLAVTMGAGLFLGEKVGWRRWSAILVGFSGVLVILQPWGHDFDPVPALFSLGAVLALVLRDLATRRIPPGVPSLSLSVWGFVVVIPAGLLVMAFGQTPTAMTLPQFGLLLMSVSVAMFAYVAMVAASRIGDVSVIAPYRYTRIVFAMVLGFLMFAETPDAGMILGLSMIVGSGLYTFLRERRLSLSKPG